MNVKIHSRIAAFLTVCLLLCLLFGDVASVSAIGGLSPSTTVSAAEDPPLEKHLLLLIVPDLSFADVRELIDHFPSSRRNVLHMAGVSMRTPGSLNLANNWLTLCTGTPGTGPQYWLAAEQRANAERGLATVPKVQVHLSEVRKIWRENDIRETTPGWLGEQLDRYGVQKYVLGNSDVYSAHRLAPLLLMDKKGKVQGWIEDEMLVTDMAFPSGRRTDFEQLTTAITRIWDKDTLSVTAVELGDLRRIHAGEQTGGMNRSEHIGKMKEDWIQEWAMWLDKMITVSSDDGISSTALQTHQSNMDRAGTAVRDTAIWIISPMVSAQAKQEGQWLAPLVMINQQSAGFLTSATTKQLGVVANIDILPSILAYFDISWPNILTGKPIVTHKSLTKDRPPGAVSKLGERFEADLFFKHLDYLFAIYAHRRTVISAYLFTVIFSLIGSTIYWFFYKNELGTRGIHVLIGTILVSPIYFLWLTPFIQYVHEMIWIIILFLCSLTTSLLLYLLLSHASYLMVLGLGTAFVIMYDVWQGSVWMKRSFLGYDPLIGARFYGLGNEYAGILLGSSLLGVTGLKIWLHQKKRSAATPGMMPDARYGTDRPLRSELWLIVLTGLWYSLIVFTVAAPHLGTNAGATVASLLTYVFSIYFLWPFRLRFRHVLGVLFLLGGIFLLLAYLHVRGGEHTHIGAFLQWMIQGDWQAIKVMVGRKLEMNLKLIRISLWGKLFATSLVVLLILSFYLHKNRFEKSRLSDWSGGFRAMIVGSVVILLVNDSGIVSAAALMIYLTFPVIYLRFVPHDQPLPAKHR